MGSHMELFGCREGNLKGIDVRIPYGKLTVVTGVSGSGKSSLAFKTVFAEGRRRIIESLDPQESYFISPGCAPKIDLALGVPPAVAIRQTQHIRSPRSTLGTISHVNQFLYLLYAMCGDVPCAHCREDGSDRSNPAYATKCSQCGSDVPRLQPGSFSSTSPSGACRVCEGAGVLQEVDETLLYPDQALSISQGGLAYGGPTKGTTKYGFFDRLLGQFGFNNDTPIKDLSQEAKVALLYGVRSSKKYRVEFPGLVPTIMQTFRTTRSERVRSNLRRFVVESLCPDCAGHGIGTIASSVTIDGTTIHEMVSLGLAALGGKLQDLEFDDVRNEIASVVRRKAVETISTMVDLGIGYLSLSRRTASLSGGEMHRARMAAQLASQLSGVIYVIDEPSAGVHAEELARLVAVMLRLRDMGGGNTVLAVEHDPEVISVADHVIEIGPGASGKGGSVVCSAPPAQVRLQPTSATGWLLSSLPNTVRRPQRPASGASLGIRHASSNNLRNVDVDIPLSCLVAVTGVSGSGKSSLVFDSLCTYAKKSPSRTRLLSPCRLVGRDLVDEIILSDQSPISRSSRSVVATYVDVFGAIRKLFARTESARKLRLQERHFSFNTSQGACQTCGGHGTIEPDSPLLSGVEFTCPECQGRRFSGVVLSAAYAGRSIAEVLDMDVSEARGFFQEHRAISRRLEVLDRVGLGYLALGQDTVDLSGGEAQRVKLAVDLMSSKRSRALYVFDEPTAGLHARDVQTLLILFDELLDAGNSIVVVEHDLQLIRVCDYVVELGPGAGADGGRVVATGTPVDLMDTETATGRALRRFAAQ